MRGVNMHLSKRLFHEVGVCFLFFVYLYPLRFVFFPWASTRVILGIIGIGWLLLNIISGKINFREINRKWVFVSILLLSLLLASYLTSAVNGIVDTNFSYYACSMVLILFAGYTIFVIVLKAIGDFTFKIISHYIVKVVVIQMLITLAMFIFPEFRNFLLSLLTDEFIPEYGGNIRLWGLGAHSFTTGVINSFALLAIAINSKNACARRKIGLFCSALLITVVGSCMSRTTLVGVVGACCIMLYGTPVLTITRDLFRYSFVLLGIVFLVMYVIPGNILEEKIEPYFKYGFEIYYNYVETGEMRTASTEELAEMRNTYPRSVKTWLIGDGRFVDSVNPELYYMYTDVGYARLVFYYGLLGCGLYFLYQFLLIKIAYDCSEKKVKLFFIILFFLLLLLNVKGFTDFTPWVGIFLFCTDRSIKSEVSVG